MKRKCLNSAFTLLELVVVVAIISLLAAMLFPVFSSVRRQARKTAAFTEAQNIETALKQYYAEYAKWPTGLTETAGTRISGDLADILQGGNPDGSNPKQLQFMQFSRFDSNNNPVNPWAGRDTPGTADSFYYALCDRNYDNIVQTPDTQTVRRTIIVWTINGDAELNDSDYYVGTWQ